MVVIREFKEQDSELLIEIYAEAFKDEIEKGMETLTIKDFVDFSKRPEARIFVAEENGMMAGYVALSSRKGLLVMSHCLQEKVCRFGFTQ